MAKSKPVRYFEGFSARQFMFHPAVWFLVATSLVIFSAIELWERYSQRIIEPGKYAIFSAKIEINPPPTWFGTDLQNEFRNGLSRKQSLLSPELVSETAEIAKSIPWVRQVNFVKKRSSGLQIDLDYRTPAAIVETREKDPVVVDGEGVLFDRSLLTDSDLERLDSDLMRISMFQLDLQTLSAWQQSADVRLRHAARLCGFLQPCYRELQLYRIVSLDPPLSDPEARPQFEIWTRNGTRIGWGSSPGSETDGEALSALKIELIEGVAKTFGGLELFPHRDQQTIHVVSGTVRYIEKIRNAEIEQLHNRSRQDIRIDRF